MSYRFAICTLNQWSLDFRGNKERIFKSIDLAIENGADYRAGPELEICGYSLEDAFYEWDTVYHSWLVLIEIINKYRSNRIVIDVGMPVFNGSLYNCRVIVFGGKILCIRAKTSLAREGNYRENRHFTPWDLKSGLVNYILPNYVSSEIRQNCVPFGANFILELSLQQDNEFIRIGWEICQELWDSKNISSILYQDFGCHIILNGSASYWELRKLNNINDMIKGISLKGGGCYGFSNLIGCDGQRYVFFGRSCFYDRGELKSITSEIDKKLAGEVDVIYHDINPVVINVHRAQMGIRSCEGKFKSSLDLRRLFHNDKLYLETDCQILNLQLQRYSNFKPLPLADLPNSAVLKFQYEIRYYVSLWLWDYLRKSKMSGFIIPLSGGLDSSSVAMLVYNMCNLLQKEESTIYFREVHKMTDQEIEDLLKKPKNIARLLLKCCYLSTKYSSEYTRCRAKLLSRETGAEFVCMDLQKVYSQFRSTLSRDTSSDDDDVTLLDQNLQARLRKDAIYYLSGGNRLVLATGNVDEAIMGYYTKYDCSSADINPIGGLCKEDLRSYLEFCKEGSSESMVQVLNSLLDACPSAELTGADQRDEDEIGISYHDISILGKVRRGVYNSSGPLGAFNFIWGNRDQHPFSTLDCFVKEGQVLNEEAKIKRLATTIKRFYDRYAKNRHKLTTLTPSLHAETYSPYDHRFDHRHFLYAPWTEQFQAIDKIVERVNGGTNDRPKTP